MFRVDVNGLMAAFDANAKGRENVGHPIDIGELRHVGESDRLIAQESGSHQHKGRILGTADTQFAVKAVAAGDLEVRLENLLRHKRRSRHGRPNEDFAYILATVSETV
jgi:hypothetical protein